MEILKFVVTDPVGLHARPATTLVSAASKFQSEATMIYGSVRTDMKSIMGVMSQAIPTNASVEVELVGEDASEAKEGILAAIVASGLGK